MDVDTINAVEMQYVAKTDIETAESRQGKWFDLPFLPLEKIYSFLDRFDQVNMSLVCHKWSEGFSSPSVWKNFSFEMTESMVSVDNYPGMKFVRKYSSMFRHVNIDYHILLPSQKDLIYIWCKHFIEFLWMLTNNSQLISVEIHNLFWCFAHIDTSTSGDVKQAIASFLGSQCYLKRLELDYCFHNLDEYADLLEALTESSRDSITHFGLRGLNYCNVKVKKHDSTDDSSLFTFLDLPSLTTLAIDYSWVLENTFTSQSVDMKTLKKHAKLWKIILDYDCCVSVESLQGLTSTDWHFLKKLYPDLKLELNFTNRFPSRQEVEFLIVPEMPIAWLNFTEVDCIVDVDDSSFMEIDVLFARLLQCKSFDFLISLSFKWELTIPDVASTFVPVIQACKKLEYFELSITYPTSGIGLLMESWLENRPESLKKVFLEIFDVEDDYDKNILKEITTKYVAALELVGIKLTINFY